MEAYWTLQELPPQHYLLCNGQAVSRTDYAELFAIIGTTWGAGNGSTTFNVPNLVGRATIGVGTYTEGSSSKTYSLGATDGSKDAIVVEHNHTQDSHYHHLRSSNSYSQDVIGYGFNADSQGVGGTKTNTWTGFYGTDRSGNQLVSDSQPNIHSTGVSGTDKNMMPYGVINKIIRAK